MSVKEVNQTNEKNIPIFDSIAIKIDEEGIDEHKIIDLDVDLPNMFSMHLTLTSTLEHSNSPESPSLDLAIVPTVLDIAPCVSCPPSLITTN